MRTVAATTMSECHQLLDDCRMIQTKCNNWFSIQGADKDASLEIIREVCRRENLPFLEAALLKPVSHFSLN